MSRDGTQFRGPLAGVTAGAMAAGVFSVGGLWMVWHRVQGPVGTMVIIIFGAVTALAVVVAAYGCGRLLVLMLLHVRDPETARFTIRRGTPVVAAEPARPVLSSQPVAELPASWPHVYYPHSYYNPGPSIARGVQEPPDVPR